MGARRRIATCALIAVTLFILINLWLFQRYSEQGDVSLITQQNNEQSPYSEIKCDRDGMSCLVSKLLIDQNGRFLLKIDLARRHEFAEYAGLFGHFGIGDPASYFYIDAWTFFGYKAFKNRQVLAGYRRLLAEKEQYSNYRFIPIFLVTDYDDSSATEVKNLTIFIQVLWKSNFFRKMYANAVAMSTCHDWFSSTYCAIDKVSFAYIGEEPDELAFGTAISDYKSKLFEYAILGLSKRFTLPETDILMPDNSNLPLISSGYRAYSNILKSIANCFNQSTTKRIFVYRKGNQRRVLNHRAMLDEFDLSPVTFEDFPTSEQVCISSTANLIIGAHGAAMAQLFFMPRSSLLVELFPCHFKKAIYRNLALVLGVRYRWWQAGDPSDCPDLPSGQVDWNSMDSKNAFRNQNFHVNTDEIRKILEFDGSKLYLSYMPYEQYNNQLISLRCACGMAYILNRTLVLPELGFRRENNDTRQVYKPKEFGWTPLGRYFNTTQLFNNIPCKTVPMSAYYGEVRVIDRIYYRRLGEKYNNRAQPESYYYFIAGLHYIHHRSLPYSIPIYNTREFVLKHFSDHSRSLRHLAMGNIFWMYNFDAPLEYPVTRYVDMYTEGSPIYKEISMALVYNPRLQRLAEYFKPSMFYGAVHWRRGDYREKCMEEKNGKACYPSTRYLVDTLSKVDPQRRLTWVILSNVIDNAAIKMLQSRRFKVHKREACNYDPIECVIIDQIVGIEAQIFIGNMYSSLTRTIADKRQELGRKNEFFGQG